MATFKAIVIEKGEAGQSVALKDFDEKDLMDGDVTVRPEYSTINYKDGLAISGKAPVVRRFPMIAGIDFAGTVETSSHPDWKPGDKVILNGWGLGETHLGAYAQKARVKGDWLVKLPAGISARDAMAIGTAGYTAMLAVIALERAGLTPARGAVLVTGAAGGVGSVAIALLAKLGYSVTASTGRPQEADYLKGLGATEIIDRQELAGPAKPIAKERWAGGDRFGRLDHAGQCAVDDPVWRGGRRLWIGRRYGSAGERGAVYFARGVTFGHRFRHGPAGTAPGGLETAGNRPGSGKTGRHDHGNSPGRCHRNRAPHYRRGCPGADRGQYRVKAFSIWERKAGIVAFRYGKRLVNWPRQHRGVCTCCVSELWFSVWSAAFPAYSQEMKATEARRFVVGKLFTFTCFEGTKGAGRIYTDGSVAGTIQFRGSGPVRYARAADQHPADQRRVGLRLGQGPAVRSLLQSAEDQRRELPRRGVRAWLRVLRLQAPGRPCGIRQCRGASECRLRNAGNVRRRIASCADAFSTKTLC